MSFEKYCEQAEKGLKSSHNKNTRDVAMCQIVTGLVYSVLALASAVAGKNDSANVELLEENKKLRQIANKALDDKNKYLDEKIKEINKCKTRKTL